MISCRCLCHSLFLSGPVLVFLLLLFVCTFLQFFVFRFGLFRCLFLFLIVPLFLSSSLVSLSLLCCVLTLFIFLYVSFCSPNVSFILIGNVCVQRIHVHSWMLELCMCSWTWIHMATSWLQLSMGYVLFNKKDKYTVEYIFTQLTPGERANLQMFLSACEK